MKTLKEFMNEDLFSGIVNKIVSIADNGDLKKLKKMKNVSMMKKFFNGLDRNKKKDMQRIMFRKFNSLPDGDVKTFAKYVTNIRIR